MTVFSFQLFFIPIIFSWCWVQRLNCL